jgi:hypothetical protein
MYLGALSLNSMSNCISINAQSFRYLQETSLSGKYLLIKHTNKKPAKNISQRVLIF